MPEKQILIYIIPVLAVAVLVLMAFTSADVIDHFFSSRKRK